MLHGGSDGQTGRQIVARRTAFWLADILSDPRARAWAFGRGGSLEFPFPVAVKTGTSQAYHDNWAIGWTREVTVGVWVGNFDRRPLRRSSGVTGAAPIFHDVMTASVERYGKKGELLDPPDGVVRRPVCALSGTQPSSLCPIVESDWLPADAPSALCSWHQTDGVRWPADYLAWAAGKGLLQDEGDQPAAQPAAQPVKAAALRITNPPAGATYLYDPTLRAEFQTLPLQVVIAGREREVVWRINGQEAGRGGPAASIDWPLSLGTHVVSVEDRAGNRDSVTIVVR